MTHTAFAPVSSADLDGVSGGAAPALDFNGIRQQAAQYCPATAARFGNVNPATVNRSTAQTMANQCLSEMGPFKAMFARAPVQQAIDSAFPRTK